MHECEQKHGNSSKTGPAVLYKQSVQGCKTAGIGQCPLCRVSHDHDGYHDLIGRQSKDESQQNDTVQSHKPSHRFQESGKMQQQGSIPTVTFASIQIMSPAGAAAISARQST